MQQLATTEDYLAVLDGHQTKFAPDERFSYCNGGYVVLALLAERASGVPFHELVLERVCDPAGMGDTAFLRSDELPGRTALGYVEVDGAWRTNVFHLPVRAAATAASTRRSPTCVRCGRRCSQERSSRRSGWRRWCDPAATPGRSATGSGSGSTPRATASTSRGRTRACRSTRRTIRARRDFTVVSNSSEGAWPLTRYLIEHPPA